MREMRENMYCAKISTFTVDTRTSARVKQSFLHTTYRRKPVLIYICRTFQGREVDDQRVLWDPGCIIGKFNSCTL